jgi:hypothetical protein
LQLQYISATTGALAASKFNLVVNGKPVNTDIKIINDRSYIPLRAVSEALGDNVGWDNKTNTISITAPTVTTPAAQQATTTNSTQDVASVYNVGDFSFYSLITKHNDFWLGHHCRS